MIMRFLIARGGPVGYVGNHGISRHLKLRELYPGTFFLVLIDLGGEYVRNEVGLQDVSIAALVAVLAFVEISLFSGKAVGEHKGVVKNELGTAVGVHNHRRVGDG